MKNKKRGGESKHTKKPKFDSTKKVPKDITCITFPKNTHFISIQAIYGEIEMV
jgi:hypothetical protein